MVRLRTLGVVALVGFVILAGCTGAGGDSAPREREALSGDGGDGSGGAAPSADAATPAATGTAAPMGTPDVVAERSAGGGGGEGGDGASDEFDARAQPALIKTGTVVLEVDDHDRARRSVIQRARGLGGYVADSGQTRHREENLTWKTGYVVLRVPSGEFSTMLEAARGEGTVLEERTSTQDVSDQLVDIEARLANLRAQREQLRQFYDEANTTGEMLRIQQRLSEVQGEIERLEARQRALEDRVAYSTLRVEIREPSPTPTPTPTPTPAPAYHETPLVAAFAASIDQLVVFARAALVTMAYALPYVLVAGTPVGLLVGGVWLRRRGG